MPRRLVLVPLRGLLMILVVGWFSLALGAGLPRLLIGTETEGLRGERAEFADFARYRADGGGIFPFGDLGLLRIARVSSVPAAEDCGQLGGFAPPPSVPRGYEASFEEYGLFGVPVGTGEVGQCSHVDRTSSYADDQGKLRPDPPVPLALYRTLYVLGNLWPILAVLSVPPLAAGGILLLRTGAVSDRRIGVAALAAALLLPSWLFVAWLAQALALWITMR